VGQKLPSFLAYTQSQDCSTPYNITTWSTLKLESADQLTCTAALMTAPMTTQAQVTTKTVLRPIWSAIDPKNCRIPKHQPEPTHASRVHRRFRQTIHA
jgi:hypothetical protein